MNLFKSHLGVKFLIRIVNIESSWAEGVHGIRYECFEADGTCHVVYLQSTANVPSFMRADDLIRVALARLCAVPERMVTFSFPMAERPTRTSHDE